MEGSLAAGGIAFFFILATFSSISLISSAFSYVLFIALKVFKTDQKKNIVVRHFMAWVLLDALIFLMVFSTIIDSVGGEISALTLKLLILFATLKLLIYLAIIAPITLPNRKYRAFLIASMVEISAVSIICYVISKGP